MVNADGSNLTKLVERGMEPAWSPDGKMIVFASKDGNIYIMDVDSINRTNITNFPHPFEFKDDSGEKKIDMISLETFQPSWSPDGKEIVFSGYGRFGRQIFLINVDGGNLTMLTNASDVGDKRDPVWSPDGRKIAFASTGADQYEYNIYVIDVVTKEVTRLTSLGDARDPSWSPP